jgi:26S proteasome subunit RPN7
MFSLIDEGGDWDRRNRLKVYRGTYCMAIRDFKTAARLFLDTVATFTSYELMDYQTFVTYTVYCSMIALSRPDLREKVEYENHYVTFIESESISIFDQFLCLANLCNTDKSKTVWQCNFNC